MIGAVVLFVITFVAALCRVSGESADAEAAVATPRPTETPTPAEIWIRYPVPLEDGLQKYIIRLCEERGISPAVILAMIGVETQGTYDPSVVGDNGESFGLMQIQPFWHMERMQRLGALDLLDPYQNVTVGIDIMSDLLTMYDLESALSYYNSGSATGAPGYVWAVLCNAEQIMEGAMASNEA